MTSLWKTSGTKTTGADIAASCGRGRGGRGGRGGRRGERGGGRNRTLDIHCIRDWNMGDRDNDDVTFHCYGNKDQLQQLLGNEDMEEALTLELVRLFSKVTRCSRNETMIQVLSFLKVRNLNENKYEIN